jgi:hypothetical protein
MWYKMISFDVLSKAKGFLCWDVFKDLAIQLVPLQNAVAYYYPPQNSSHSIVVFYQENINDFSESLFLLFHEAGHAIQNSLTNGKEFFDKMNLPNGKEKVDFEFEAWNEGRIIFNKFVKQENLDSDFMRRFDEYGVKAIESYS